MPSGNILQSGEDTFSLAKQPWVQRRTKLIAVTVALTLPLLRMSRAAGVDDELGFRYGSYNEDDSRINVTTETAAFNIGLSDNVRLTGNLVVDSISGATPTGAPPQTKWPFPTYNNYYQSSYQSAYGNQYSQFISQNQIYVDAGLITYNQLTNGAAVYAQQTAPPIATNNANASFQTLTNNPNYRKNSVPLTHMHDHRDAFAFQMPITLGRHQITPSFSHSAESDYISFGGALNYSISFNDKNTIVSAGWAITKDSVRNDVFKWVPKTTDDIFLGLVQLVSPTAYLTANLSLGFSGGYLADPYRSVMFANQLQDNPSDAALYPEKRPSHRNSETLYTSWTQFVTPANGSYELSYRFFHDSYGIIANTVALTWNQKIGKHLIISPMFRYSVQNAADFYYVLVPDSNNKPTFYSSDYRLSEMETFTTGVTIAWRVARHLTLDASYSRFVMRGLDHATSQSAYPSANIFSLGGRVYF